MTTLVIVGNGFDRFHELPTGYENYRAFLLSNYARLVDDFECFPFLDNDGPERWSDVEKTLTLAYEECLEDALGSYPLDLSADNPGWNDPTICIEGQTGFINDFTGELFFRWLLSVDVMQAENEVVFPSNSVFVTYNYTTVLEDVYGVSKSRIFHIHGSVDDVERDALLQNDYGTVPAVVIPDDWDGMDVEIARDEHNQSEISSVIQFGSPSNDLIQVRRDLEKRYGREDFYGAMIETCVAALERFCEAASKCLSRNYKALEEFVGRWNIDRVVVFGHSFDSVDRPYYEDIFVPLLGDRPWTFIVYSDKGAQKAEDFCYEAGIGDFAFLSDKNKSVVDLRRSTPDDL